MSFEASEDLTKAKYRFVVIDANGKVKLPDTAGETVHGILIVPGKSGEVVSVLTHYGTRAVLEIGTTSVAIPAGTRLTGAVDGKAVPQTGTSPTQANTHHAIVLADGLSGTTAKAGKYVSVLFIPNTSITNA